MDKAKGGKGGSDACEHAHENFHAGVTEQFFELFFRQMVLL
jgi:hypothetical protein